MKIVRGTSKENAIVVKRNDVDKNRVKVIPDLTDEKPPVYASMDTFQNILDAVFGPNDGDYFIINEVGVILDKKEYKVFYIEDKDNEKHSVFFKIEK